MDAGPNRSPVGWQLFVIYIYFSSGDKVRMSPAGFHFIQAFSRSVYTVDEILQRIF
jgi:hypothetical protein